MTLGRMCANARMCYLISSIETRLPSVMHTTQIETPTSGHFPWHIQSQKPVCFNQGDPPSMDQYKKPS